MHVCMLNMLLQGSGGGGDIWRAGWLVDMQVFCDGLWFFFPDYLSLCVLHKRCLVQPEGHSRHVIFFGVDI